MFVRQAAGDITSFAVDAAVNAANGRLEGGGGVDGAFHRAAGPAMAAAGRAHVAAHGPLATGEVFVTEGFGLPTRWVLHTVGPIWDGDGPARSAELARCYRTCLDVAVGLGARTVAFPAISTGVYGFPGDLAVEVVAEVVQGGEWDLDEVVFVLFDEETRARYAAEPALGGRGPSPGPGSAGRRRLDP